MTTYLGQYPRSNPTIQSGKAFIENIPVNGLVIALVRDDFWGKVVGCAAKRPCLVWDALCKAEISDLEVPVMIQKQVLGLQVAVDNVAGVQILQCQSDLRCIELGDRVRETLEGWQVSKQSLFVAFNSSGVV